MDLETREEEVGSKTSLLARKIATEELGLEPVVDDQQTIPGAEAHADVGASPKEVGQTTGGSNVAVEPCDVSNSLLAANISEGTLVTVVEGLHVLDAAELTLILLNLARDLGRVAGLEVERTAELSNLVLESLSPGHVVEQAREEVALLTGNLGGGGVAGNGAVTDSPDVAGTLHNKVFVYSEAAARVLLRRDTLHEILDDGTNGVAGSPDEKTVGEYNRLLGAVGASSHSLNRLVCDLFDHGLGVNVDLFLLEGALGVLDELLGEAREDVGESLDQRHAEAVADLGNQLLDVLLEEVLQLAGELDTSRATANHHHVHETVNLLGRLVLEGSRLDAVHDPFADSLSVTNLLQEA